MKKFTFQALCAVIMLSLSAFILAGGWKLKSSYEVKFSGGRISGTFKDLKTDIVFDKVHPEQAKISATIDVNSISTGFFLKNNHAKDALDAEKYPTIKFISTTVTKNGSGYSANGTLTLKGVSKPETIRFNFDDKGNEGVFKGSFKVITKDFGITKNGSPDEVTIELNVPVSKL